MQRTFRYDLAFVACCVLLLFASAADAYVNLKYPIQSIHEKNPIAAEILKQSGEDHCFLMAVKLFGTGLAMLVATMMYQFRPKLTLIAVGCAVCIQGLLLLYMFLY